MKRLFIFLVFFTSSVLFSTGLKKVSATPVSTSIKEVLQIVESKKVRDIVAKSSLKSAIMLVKELQKRVSAIIDAGAVSVKDIQFLEHSIVQMKVIVALMSNNTTKKVDKELLALSIDAVQALDSLVIGSVDHDVAYIKDLLLILSHQYEQGFVDYKKSLRILAIIEELFQRYDGVFISAYTVVVLLQVALTVFLLQVS